MSALHREPHVLASAWLARYRGWGGTRLVGLARCERESGLPGSLEIAYNQEGVTGLFVKYVCMPVADPMNFETEEATVSRNIC